MTLQFSWYWWNQQLQPQQSQVQPPPGCWPWCSLIHTSLQFTGSCSNSWAAALPKPSVSWNLKHQTSVWAALLVKAEPCLNHLKVLKQGLTSRELPSPQLSVRRVICRNKQKAPHCEVKHKPHWPHMTPREEHTFTEDDNKNTHANNWMMWSTDTPPVCIGLSLHAAHCLCCSYIQLFTLPQHKRHNSMDSTVHCTLKSYILWTVLYKNPVTIVLFFCFNAHIPSVCLHLLSLSPTQFQQMSV